MAFAETLSTFVADFGVKITAGAYQTQANFDAPDHSVLGDRAHSKEYSIVYIANTLGPLKYGSYLNVSGTPGAVNDGQYKVLIVHDIDDGQFQRAVLEKP